MKSLSNFINESMVSEAISEKQAKKIFQDMYDEDGEVVSLASCYGWLEDINWEVLSANKYAKYINDEMGIDADMVMWYSRCMVAMAQLGKERTLACIKEIADEDEMEDYDVFKA